MRNLVNIPVLVYGINQVNRHATDVKETYLIHKSCILITLLTPFVILLNMRNAFFAPKNYPLVFMAGGVEGASGHHILQ